MTEIGHKLFGTNHAEWLGQHIEDHQLFRVIDFMQASKRVGPEELGEDLDTYELPIVGMVDEHFLDSASELILKDIDAFRKVGVGLNELLDADLGESELTTSSPKAVPAKFPIPFPVQIRAVVFLESNASPVRA